MPRRHQPRPPESSVVMVFAGDGWGKSSAALGYAVRSAGRGWRTSVIQFVKGGAWNAAEARVGKKAGIHWPVLTPVLTWAQREPTALSAAAWEQAQLALVHEEPGLVVLDELSHAVSLGWLDLDAVLAAIRGRNPLTSVIITGQELHEQLLEVADTVTRFELVKHDMKRGILAPE